MQGIKRKRRCQNQCQEHLFQLINFKNNPKYDIKLTFCPKYQRQPLPPQHTYAEYNDDRLYYTSAFVLGVDKKQVSKNLQKQMLDHQKLIKQNCQKYNQIIFPRPNSKHIKCSVCKEDYKNYYQHIFSDQHGQKIQSSGYNKYIKQLCELFKDFWDGCEQKADNEVDYLNEKSKLQNQQNQDQQLNLDQLQEQIIQEEQFQNEQDQVKQISQRQIVMKRHPRMTTRPVERTIQPVFSQKVYEDRQSRKKSINFRQYFEQYPKKKIIDDNRQAISLTKKLSKQGQSMNAKTKPNSEITLLNKRQQVHQDDPFTIQYNARQKKKQKKSYYYIKKRQREQRQQRQRQLMIDRNQEENQNQNYQQINYQYQNNLLPQQQIQQKQQKQEKQLPKYYHEPQSKMQKIKDNYKIKDNQKSITQFNINTKLKQNQLFQVIDKKNYQNNLQQKNNTFQNYQANKNIIQTEADVPKKDSIKMQLHFDNKNKRKLQHQFKHPSISSVANSQTKQQYLQKNKIDQQEEYNLPLHHKFRRDEKQTTKQKDLQFSKVNKQIFNDYQEKLKQYNQQKNYYKRQDKHQQPNQLFPQDQTTVRMTKSFQQPNQKTAQTNQRHLYEQGYFDRSVKSQTNNKYRHFQDNYYKKNINEKQLNPLLPPNIYTDHPIYNPHSNYGHVHIPGYPYHQMAPLQRQMQKDGRVHTRRPRQMYEYQPYYPYMNPYYSHPPSQIPLNNQIAPQTSSLPRQHQKSLQKQYQTPLSKSLQKKPYVPYPSYPSYIQPYTSPYYPPTQSAFPPSPYPPTSRQSPNTSIHINLPMCMPPNYPNQNYNYQPRYPDQRQYQQGQQIGQQGLQGQQGQMGNMQRQRSTLMPYAEYQQYKKRNMN